MELHWAGSMSFLEWEQQQKLVLSNFEITGFSVKSTFFRQKHIKYSVLKPPEITGLKWFCFFHCLPLVLILFFSAFSLHLGCILCDSVIINVHVKKLVFPFLTVYCSKVLFLLDPFQIAIFKFSVELLSTTEQQVIDLTI